MAAVEPDPVGQKVLREWPEVRQPGEHGQVRQAQVVLGQGRDQHPVADPRIGVGFAFASLANLVVNAVAPHQTGEATGNNTIMRTIGGTFGA